jgi:23S rRNA pseudouridine1911/1915/1917 synthase
MRLDQYVAQFWPEYSRSVWQKYIAAGFVHVNDVPQTSTKYALGEDDEVTVHIPEDPDYSKFTLPIIYEDDHVIVINKPAGVLTHAKGEVSEEFTVADFVRPRMREPEMTNRPGIVHRLDRDTSGIIICAKDSEAKTLLQKQFQDRKAHKTYLAVVRGTPKQLSATLDLPIERNPKKPSTHRVGPNGKPAITRYEVLSSNATFSVIRLYPETGRTHQLRVHLAYLGTPIVGDRLYGSEKSPINRLCLHAEELEITIPVSRRETFRAEPPHDLKTLMDRIHG